MITLTILLILLLVISIKFIGTVGLAGLAGLTIIGDLAVAGLCIWLVVKLIKLIFKKD